LDLAETKAESERLARALLEEQYFELSQESKKAASRHRQEMADKDSIIRRVIIPLLSIPIYVLQLETEIYLFSLLYNVLLWS